MASSQQKIRKKRKPMTSEQRKAASERLAKAREARLAKNPPKNASIHPSVRELKEDHPLSMKNVKEYIKYQKDIRSLLKQAVRRNEKGALAKLYSCDGYIKNMEGYLRNGTWLDAFYGNDQNKRVKFICHALAYHHTGKYKGMAKRNVGVYYPDLGQEWTREMDKEYYHK